MLETACIVSCDIIDCRWSTIDPLPHSYVYLAHSRIFCAIFDVIPTKF